MGNGFMCVSVYPRVSLSHILSSLALGKNRPNGNQTTERIRDIDIFRVAQTAPCSYLVYYLISFPGHPWCNCTARNHHPLFPGEEVKAQTVDGAWSGSPSKAVVCWPGNRISWFRTQHLQGKCLRLPFWQTHVNPLRPVLRILTISEHRPNGLCPLVLPVCPVWDKLLHSSHLCNYSDVCYFPSLSYSFVFLKIRNWSLTAKSRQSTCPRGEQQKKQQVTSGVPLQPDFTNSLSSKETLGRPWIKY